ncbi:MAG: hypothetical protein AAFX50_21265 [Acidobacteriota bacterium]
MPLNVPSMPTVPSPGGLRRRALSLGVTALVQALWLVGCADSATVAAPSSGQSDSASEAAAPDVASAEPASSAVPPLPAAADGDVLPRSYAGFTLGEPPPADAELRDGPPSFYPEASQYLVRLSESPKTTVGLYVHDGAVFRIEWRVKDASLERDAVVEAFAARLGPPEEPSPYLPKGRTYWSDGLVDGKTTVTVFRIDESEWFRVAFEDSGRGAALMSLGN